MKFPPVEMHKVTTVPLAERRNKVSWTDLSNVPKDDTFFSFLGCLPSILKARDLLLLIDDILTAYRSNKPIVAMLGGHVIKCGLSPLIIALIQRSLISAVAMNGAASIHDFEIALVGGTSEEVSEGLSHGSFGMSEETGRLMNEAFLGAVTRECGMGNALGQKLFDISAPFNEYSVLAACVQYEIPITVHVAIGTDIIHQHPSADGSSMGEATYQDFEKFVSVVAQLGEGGILLNFGSAVLLPEVFLKALAIAQNLGYNVKNFTTANFDMIQSYRATQNIVKRPSSKGYQFTGHHEIMIPLLTHIVLGKWRRLFNEADNG